MSVLLFVTVGNSALHNPELGTVPAGRDNRELRSLVQDYKDKPEQEKEGFAHRWGLLELLIRAHRSYWAMPDDHTSNPANFQQSSAELTSTMAMLRNVPGLRDRVTQIVLLASDTQEGRLSAEIDRVTLATLLPGVSAVVEVVRGLNAQVIDTRVPLGEIVQKHTPVGDETGIFNITGGYKGTIPSITWLALKRGWRMYYQHETLDKPVYVHFTDQGIEERATPWRV